MSWTLLIAGGQVINWELNLMDRSPLCSFVLLVYGLKVCNGRSNERTYGEDNV